MTAPKLPKVLAALLAVSFLAAPSYAEKIPTGVTFETDDALCVEGRCYSNPAQAPGGDWVLPDGNWQPSIFDLAVWYPRDDAETQDWNYAARGCEGHEKIVPVAVVGNPTTYITVNSGPPGITVDNDPDVGGAGPTARYSTLTIPNSAIWSGEIDLTVCEQGGTCANYDWSYATVDDDDTNLCVHLDAAASAGGDGTHATPFDTLADILTNDDQDATFQGAQVFVTGTFTLAGAGVEYNGPYVKLNANKPLVWVASSIGGATWQGSASNNPAAQADASAFDYEGGTDATFVGFNWRNPRVFLAADNFRNIFVDASSAHFQYGGFFFNDFDLDSPQGSPGANSTPIFLSQSSYDGYILFYGNHFRDGGFLSPITIYDTHHVAVIKNSMAGIESANGWFLKGGDNLEDYTFRLNVGITGNTGYLSKIQAIDYEGAAGTNSRRRIEFTHNIWKSTLGGIWMDGAADFGEFGISSKRNNWIVTDHDLDGSDLVTGSAVFDFDIGECSAGTECVSDDGTTLGFSITRGDFQSSGLDDTTAEQTTPNCTHGAEVCGSALFTAPDFLDASNDDAFEMRIAA